MRSALPLLFVLAATGAHADPPEIVAAEARRDGAKLGRRVLLHPHETEQPFTGRRGVEIPDALNEVVIRAHCSVDGWATTEMRLPLAR